MVHPQLSWSWKSLAASLSPVLYNADLLLCLTSGQTPEIVTPGGERGINLSCTLGKITLQWGMDEAPHLHLTTEDLCTRKSVWPVLPHSGSHQLMTSFVAWGWERAAHNSVNPWPWNSHTTLKHWLERSFSTMLLEMLPQFCVRQPGEVPEQGLSHQSIPLPFCSTHTVHNDLFQNQLGMISWKAMNQTSSKTLEQVAHRGADAPFLEICKDGLNRTLSNLV